MMSFRIPLIKKQPRQMVRPWALAGPIILLLISVPLARPILHPATESMSDDEQSRLATVQAIVEHKTLAIDQTLFGSTTRDARLFKGRTYSTQPPALALLLSGPYWVLHRFGMTFDRSPLWVMFLLTLVGVTIPVSLAAGLVYKMGRLFELPRPHRAALGLAVVLGSGLISYSTVLNPHAPAAVLLLASIGAMLQVGAISNLRRAATWLFCAGFLAALAAVIDPPCLLFAVLLIAVVASFRWSFGSRGLAVAIYVLGAAGPLAAHAQAAKATGGSTLTATLVRPEITTRRLQSPTDDDDDDTATGAAGTVSRFSLALLGPHGILSHFPVLVLGLFGIGLVLHRHWPAATKMLACVTIGGGTAIVLIFCLSRVDWGSAMFGSRWFVAFLPLTLFWSGAWLRRPHRPLAWSVAGSLLLFSIVVSIIGATGPLPREGFDRYTAVGAAINLLHPPPLASQEPILARR